MTDFRAVVSDASAGENLAELPLSDLTFNRVLSGVGSLSGSVSVDHPAATEDNLIGDREITVFREDVPVWNGPITGLDASRSGGTVDISAREASWYLGKRTIEVDKTYTGEDVFDIVRDLVDYMQTKTDATYGDILADLPRFNVTSGLAGATVDASFAGSARHTVQEAFDFLSVDPETGFDWRMDYKTGSTRQSVVRTLTLGYPSLGVDRTEALDEHVLLDFSRNLDWERAATRVHVLGSGFTATRQNNQSIIDGKLLLENVTDLSDTSDHSFISAYAKEYRRVSQPPVQTLTVSFVPGNALAYDFCDLGDVIPFAITAPSMLSVTANTRRVVDIATSFGDEGEVVSVTFNLPLTDLGD